MRPPNRSQFPPLPELLQALNAVLQRCGRAPCTAFEAVCEEDTANPTIIACSLDHRYVVKVCLRYPERLCESQAIANAIRARCDLPIPNHYGVSDPGDPWPLLIMQYLPGRSLASVFAHAGEACLRTIMGDLGRCLGIVHDPSFLDLLPPGDAVRHEQFWLTRCRSARGYRNREVMDCLEQWRHGLHCCILPAVEKADQDLKDLLVSGNRISGILDWERVQSGDGIYGLCIIYLRLFLADRLELWNYFLQAYVQQRQWTPRPTKKAKFLLTARAAVAAERHPRARLLLDACLSGACEPFGA